MKRRTILLSLVAVVVLSIAASVAPNTDKYFEILKNIEIYTNLYKEVNTYYVDDIDPGKLMRTGIDAMVGSLDPFTNYISESDIEGYRFQTEGRYHGIGAMSEAINGIVTITELYQDQPADKAGLKPGDQILAIDGKDATGRNVEEVNEILRGFPGTSVALTVRRPGRSDEFKVTLVRGDVNVPNVPYHGMVGNNIGYIALTTFTRDAGRNITSALKELKQENPDIKGVILDLRWNGGGLLNEAVDICNIFIPRDELVVTTRGKVKEWDRSYKTLNAPVDLEIPLAILVNKRSASASEIVSGVVQDYDRGVLIGQRTYGKGLVQNTMDIGYNARVKITTAKYYIPSQRCIQSVEYKDGEPLEIPDARRAKFKTRAGRTVLDGGGVKPDIVVDVASDEGIVKALLDQHLIFDYVTQWALKHPTIDSVSDFRFTEFADFERFLKEKKFDYESDSEALLEKIRKEAADEELKLDAELLALTNKINSAQQSELERHKAEVIDLIEKEIAGRYYYQRGKVQIGLRNDREIAEAVGVLNDPARYRKLLSAQ